FNPGLIGARGSEFITAPERKCPWRSSSRRNAIIGNPRPVRVAQLLPNLAVVAEFVLAPTMSPHLLLEELKWLVRLSRRPRRRLRRTRRHRRMQVFKLQD